MRFSPSLFTLLVYSLLLLITVAEARDAGPEKSDEPLPIPEVLFIPTPGDVVVQMLELAKVQKDDLVYDLGCGDGRILVTAVHKFGCRAAGFDIDPRRVKQARENLAKNGMQERAKVEEKDLFEVDLRPASVITLYLSPKFNERLIPQLGTLSPGSRIISHQYEMKGVQPEKEVHYRSKVDGRIHTLFLWTTPLEPQKNAQNTRGESDPKAE
jgi:SAM-dependent methyltransferase